MTARRILRKLFPNSAKRALRKSRAMISVGKTGLAEWAGDYWNARGEDHGPEKMIELGLAWLKRAQDCSSSQDGGVARHYSFKNGWAPSYPETTGYIIPTFLQHAKGTGDADLKQRAERMLNWEASIQLPSGAFQGSTIGVAQVHPVVFDTGQVLQGLAAGVVEFGDKYRPAMTKAADWLVKSQDPDGAWRVPNPFSIPGDHTWETHVAWGLLEAARVETGRGYGEAALRNIYWAVGRQSDNGWFSDCCLDDVEKPLTHTIGYVLRGVIEGYRYSREKSLLDSCLKAANGICGAIDSDGRLSGRLDRTWRPAARWVCLTGSSQIAICLLLLHLETGDRLLLDAALRLNRFVRSTVHCTGPEDLRGGIKGSFPVNGDYSPFELPNWACKFTVDAAALELQVTS